MIRQSVLIGLVLFSLVVLPKRAMSEGKAGDVAIGLDINDGVQLQLPFRIWATHRLTFEPSIGISYDSPPVDKDTLRLQFGLGLLYHGRPDNSLRPYGGLRVDLNILTNTGITANDLFITPTVGAEYFLSKRFSFSGEFLLEIGFTDSKQAATRGYQTDRQSLRTKQRLVVFFYM